MTQLLVAHMKLKMILKLIQKFNPCVNKIVKRNFQLGNSLQLIKGPIHPKGSHRP